MKKFLFIILAVLALLIGLYPLIYVLVDHKYTFLSSKTSEILSNSIWRFAFFCHIILGAISLLIGWRQFGAGFRNKHKKLHRLMGKIYILSVIISSMAGIYLGFYANGNIVSSSGFVSLGVIWFITTVLAFLKIKRGDIIQHQNFMTYSYACTFAAVTLRLWMPLLKSIITTPGLSYLIVAWLCWVPNLMVAYFINRKRSLKKNIVDPNLI
ncbi:hypothetical protein CEY12_01730 [Chryseobacterium sp. T16E-39]|uniref:DUF2306 domain-containing protein n=1 Tax=Chryseobacterium sp. T16E-39 TaxID=2015076 RepID=UPI000B5B26E5|nr:DUF2306 domain-containing protein [Chryseobacterium sp. T16E-39]ASK28905.1 hypothetical protein CEY12_01730 [Chryseobacterium sp. T16E-39]